MRPLFISYFRVLFKYQIISLVYIVFPEVTVRPESKIRVENQTMTLCCVGVGKPGIKYEW
jgi:hypothetical protein